MTRTLTLRSGNIPSAFPSIHKFGIGFDDLFGDLARQHEIQTNSYPPYNILKTGEDTFEIEIAAAGFGQDDLSVKLDNRVLSIKGAVEKNAADIEVEYLHRGLSGRDFERSFTLAEHVEVDSVTMKNGILSVKLERRIPPEKLPKTLDITFLS